MTQGKLAVRERPEGYQLVAFDVDGTLIESSDGKVIWQLLNRRFGGADEVNARRYQDYLAGKISYPRWVDLDIGDWITAGARREQIVEVIEQHLRLVPGARETLDTLVARGYRLAVISGTLDITLDVLFPEHPFEEVFTNAIWFEPDGRIAGWRATPYDMEGKAQALAAIAARMGVPLERTVFVGDHINDLQVMGKAGLAVAYEPKDPRVAAAAKVVLRQDLRGLLDVL